MRLEHHVAPYLLDPQNPIKVLLVGCGGNGSQMLNGLARMHVALRGLGHPGFHVVAVDPDTVSKANLGRQPFAESDVGQHKTTVLITRLNRFFGLEWTGVPLLFGKALIKHNRSELAQYILNSNLVITCVDSAQARLEASKVIKKISRGFYHLDLGNTRDTGQIILATIKSIKQPAKKGFSPTLPSLVDLWPNLLAADNEEDQGPSCSLVEALSRQDLFVNSTLSNLALDILWKMFSDLKLTIHGAFMNLKRMQVSPLWIDPEGWKRMKAANA